MATKIVTGPAREPITLQQAKNHLRIDHSDDDEAISVAITMARQAAESFTRRALITQTWDLSCDWFPHSFALPFAPLQSVTSITYLDSAGASQVLATSVYRVDTSSEPGRVTLEYGQVWPATRGVTNSVTIRFVAGYGDSATAVPAPIRQAMLMMIGEAYEMRELSVVGASPVPVVMGADRLLMPYVIDIF